MLSSANDKILTSNAVNTSDGGIVTAMECLMIYSVKLIDLQLTFVLNLLSKCLPVLLYCTEDCSRVSTTLENFL